MLEKQIIQSVGFRNIKEGDKVTGFQFKIRLPYYRGVFLCQLRLGTLIVDGEKFTTDDYVWNIGGKDYTYDDIKKNKDIHWAVTEPAIIKVKKEGGLAQGYHDLTYGFCFTSSYMAPSLNELDPDKELFIFFPEFGKHVHNRRMIIV